jgi:hypothetical protein
VVKFTPWPFYLGKITPALIEEEAGWVTKLVWTCRRRKNLWPPPGFEPVTVHSIA